MPDRSILKLLLALLNFFVRKAFALEYRAAVQFLIFFASSPSKPVHFASRSPRLE